MSKLRAESSKDTQFIQSFEVTNGGVSGANAEAYFSSLSSSACFLSFSSFFLEAAEPRQRNVEPRHNHTVPMEWVPPAKLIMEAR